MANLIDKSALVAEIKRRINEINLDTIEDWRYRLQREHDIEEASYQYMYDASNDWAYDIPTWKDVQDAFKAGSEWKEGLELSWKDIKEICVQSVLVEVDLGRLVSDERHYTEVLKRFNKQRKEK